MLEEHSYGDSIVYTGLIMLVSILPMRLQWKSMQYKEWNEQLLKYLYPFVDEVFGKFLFVPTNMIS